MRHKISEDFAQNWPIREPDGAGRLNPANILNLLGVQPGNHGQFIENLPFSLHDTTAGSETELQAVVVGRREDVDLPVTIEQSNYFANILRRAAAGETPRSLLTDLERFLAGNQENVWENSWVRFPRRNLSPYAGLVFDRDLLADKGNPAGGYRGDCGRFIFRNQGGEEQLRLPISYLIKLALADVLGSPEKLPETVRLTGERLLGHFLNDNTSPETFSFHVVPLRPATGMGRGIARETAKRYILTQLLVMYANESFGLAESGQKAMVYFAPHPPVRQQELNTHVSDAFYRELFMSPCLSGWDRGEEKYRYMQLCHQVLSRSQLNGVAKLREAGIIVNNLVVLPNVSNVSLANNGTHLSLGSRRLSAALADPSSGFTPAHEKHLGDLVIKMTEHFLPLFVGTYSAAPYRLSFTDFHPERALGFLPHELDYTHLRMLWRRWQKKARLSVFGRPVTPFGPEWLDRMVSGLFGLKGDFVPDFRLIDYLVCLMSTDESPALDGTPGNGERLRRDLADLGVFDGQMSVYLLYKLREHAAMGFSGFEGRHYSQFESLEDDLGGAADLQTLITALAFKYLAQGKLSHPQIPDDPSVESERRQIFFGAAAGIPTFYVRKESGNLFLRRILLRTREVRASRRYPGYLRVCTREYCRALVQILLEDGADLIEALNLSGTMEELMARLEHPDRHSAAGKLTRGILATLNAKSPLAVGAREFNQGAEKFYREMLRQRHMAEACRFLEEDCLKIDQEAAGIDDTVREALQDILEGGGAADFLRKVQRDVLAERTSAPLLRKLIGLVLFTVQRDTVAADRELRTS
ncbi:MAG: hypothetical protein NDI77_02630 [Geobacteraceae bacterium]|nr:hypothetical protein [Geobacteraceae bacterium]